MGHDDYQRMLLQQQQNQAIRSMSSASPASFNQQMMGSASAMSQQQQHHQQQQQQFTSSQMQQQQGGYGMSPPNSAMSASFGGPAGGMSAPSPKTWGTTPSQGGYPFASSPSVADLQRHMSGTPVPQQQQSNNTSPVDPFSGVLDLFNWDR
jgi:hypothetical protein